MTTRLGPSDQIDPDILALEQFLLDNPELDEIETELSVFNPFGPHFREKLGAVAANGTNYGGEIIGPQAMATARLRY